MSGKNWPTVSIVTPSLNQGHFIEQTILSVRRQDYPNVEHIVIDGGSSDNTLSILKKYERTYNMRWLSESDNGMYEAINKGMKQAKGEILAYLNADDLYFPWTVRMVARSFYRHPRVDVVYGEMIYVVMGREYGSIIFNPPPRMLQTHLRLFGSITQPTTFWRRHVFESLNGFDESLHFSGDYDFWARASRTYHFMRLNEILATFRVHQGSKSLRGLADQRLEDAKIRFRYYGHVNSRKVLAEHILYEFLEARYHTAKLFLLCRKNLSKAENGGSWQLLLRTKALSRPSLRGLFISFVPGLTYALNFPLFSLLWVSTTRLSEIATGCIHSSSSERYDR